MPRPREIDKWPKPATKRPMKVVVMSCSRNATMGLFEAFRILGYYPYHMLELGRRGVGHIQVLEQAIKAHHDRFSSIKKCGRKEFDKWFSNYDVIIEIPSFLGTDVVEAYIDDPDVKFLLTERDPDAWVRSFNGFVVLCVLAPFRAFPMNVAKHFDPFLSNFVRLNELVYDVWSSGIPYGVEGNEKELRRNYVEYNESVKKLISPERLHVIKLETGLGWEQLCPYLDKPIPDVPYPKGTSHKELVSKGLAPLANRALIKLGVVSIAGLGVAACVAFWYVSWGFPKLYELSE